MFWRVLRNYRKILKLLNLLKESYSDKRLSEDELKKISDEILKLLVELRLVEKK